MINKRITSHPSTKPARDNDLFVSATIATKSYKAQSNYGSIYDPGSRPAREDDVFQSSY